MVLQQQQQHGPDLNSMFGGGANLCCCVNQGGSNKSQILISLHFAARFFTSQNEGLTRLEKQFDNQLAEGWGHTTQVSEWNQQLIERLGWGTRT